MTKRAVQTRGRKREGGFTLAEILVALALMALLAAVLIPTVGSQIMKGDTGRVVQDLTNVRGGMEQFLADVRRFPGKYSDLSKLIVASSAAHTDINGNQYPSGLVSKWKGPYVTKDTLSSTVESGFGGLMKNVFGRFTHTNGVQYVTVVITGIDSTSFYLIDEQIDGPSTPPAGKTTGLLRFATGGGDSTKFFALPIQ